MRIDTDDDDDLGELRIDTDDEEEVEEEQVDREWLVFNDDIYTKTPLPISLPNFRIPKSSRLRDSNGLPQFLEEITNIEKAQQDHVPTARRQRLVVFLNARLYKRIERHTDSVSRDYLKLLNALELQYIKATKECRLAKASYDALRKSIGKTKYILKDVCDDLLKRQEDFVAANDAIYRIRIERDCLQEEAKVYLRSLIPGEKSELH